MNVQKAVDKMNGIENTIKSNVDLAKDHFEKCRDRSLNLRNKVKFYKEKFEW